MEHDDIRTVWQDPGSIPIAAPLTVERRMCGLAAPCAGTLN